MIASAVFLLMTSGVYLLMQRSLLRVAIGLSLLSHAIHLVVLSSGTFGRRAPLALAGAPPEQLGDPLPQAFVLTAIVISMAITVYLLAGIASTSRGGRPAEVEPAPSGDGERSPAALRSELEGREDAPWVR